MDAAGIQHPIAGKLLIQDTSGKRHKAKSNEDCVGSKASVEIPLGPHRVITGRLVGVGMARCLLYM